MFQDNRDTNKRTKNYEQVIKQLDALVDGEPDLIANLSNASALLNQFLDDINWVGFYLWKDNELVIGPFQGLPACIRLPYGQGVCGSALKEKQTKRVNDVNQFPGHIACDSASRSEIVIPMMYNDKTYGVLDIDSPLTSRFDDLDQKYLELFVSTLLKHIK